jgi:hypothetical protein
MVLLVLKHQQTLIQVIPLFIMVGQLMSFLLNLQNLNFILTPN